MMGLAGKLINSKNGSPGVNWTYQPGLISSGWSSSLVVNSVARGGSVFCVVGANGRTATSSDGVTWSYVLVSTITFNAVAWNGAIFCAVTSLGTVYTSPDGSTWTSRGALPSAPTTCNAVNWNGSVFCIGGSGGYIATSPTGTTWTYQSQLSTTTWATSDVFAIASKGAVLCVVGTSGTNTRAATSTDNGVNWTYQAGLRTAIADSIPRCITSSDSIFCVGADSGKIATSSDGVTWTYQTSLRGTTWGTGQSTSAVYAITWNGSKFCIAGGSGTGTGGKVATSLDGVTWTYQPGLIASSWGTTTPQSIASTSNKFIVVGNGGAVATSP